MKTIRTLAALASAAALLSACGGGGNDVGKELGLQNPEIHFVHALPGGPNVDFLVNGSPLQTNIGYKQVTNFANINTGNTNVAYANTGSTTAIASGNFPDVAKGHEYTVLALPALTGGDIGLIDDPFDKGLLSNDARVRAFNATVNAQNLDIYIVAAGTSIASVSPTMAGVAFKNAVPASGQDSIYLSGGTYVAIVTAAGSKTPIFQSDSFNLANNADWLITTVPIAGTLSELAPGQIHLLVAQGGNTSQPAVELTNTLTNQ
jgi:dipeptidyl aminopeptidase/acylaminoacyl peptidase